MSTKFVVVFLVAIVTTLGCGKRHTPEERLVEVTQATGNKVSVCAITITNRDGLLEMEYFSLGLIERRILLDKVGEDVYCGAIEVGRLAQCRLWKNGIQRLTVTYMGVTEGGSRKLMTQDIPPDNDFYEFWVGLQKAPVIFVSPRQSSDPPLVPPPIVSGTK
ncbi:MAG: hypothetical protein PHC53_05525 [Patescibacteria group bacterium]|nr:hypothetical protein [Patescibacteria group bacterium]